MAIDGSLDRSDEMQVSLWRMTFRCGVVFRCGVLHYNEITLTLQWGLVRYREMCGASERTAGQSPVTGGDVWVAVSGHQAAGARIIVFQFHCGAASL